MILQLENINKHYLQDKLEVPVLKNITFEVEAGEYVAIMGPSGSGKSTLMNILGCLDLPSSGSYHLNGLDVSKLNDVQLSDLRLKEIGFEVIFEGYDENPAKWVDTLANANSVKTDFFEAKSTAYAKASVLIDDL